MRGLNPTMDTCSGSLAFFTNIDETAPMDLTIGTQVVTAEAPTVPLIVGLGAVAALDGVVIGRRRGRRTAV
jgi:hypothetical protein